MNRLCILSVLFLLFTSGCVKNKLAWNEEISDQLKEEISARNESVIDALMRNDSIKIDSLVSKRRRDKALNADSLVRVIRGTVLSKEYSVLALMHQPDPPESGRDSLVSPDSTFRLMLDSGMQEYCVSLVLLKGETSQVLLTTVHEKQENDWMIYSIRAGTYSYGSKNAVDFYRQAINDYDRGHLIGAANNIGLARATARPAGSLFVYQSEEEMKTFARKAIKEVSEKYPMPLKVTQIKTTPYIFNVRPFPVAEGIFPLVAYVTRINLKDTVRLKKENDELQRILDKIFPGIGTNSPYIFLQAYNELPSGSKRPAHHEFVMRTN